MDVRELANQIYDTLFQNVGFSEHHVALDLDEIECQFVGCDWIFIQYKDKAFELTIREVERMEETE